MIVRRDPHLSNTDVYAAESIPLSTNLTTSAAKIESSTPSYQKLFQFFINENAGLRHSHKFLMLFALTATVSAFFILNPADCLSNTSYNYNTSTRRLQSCAKNVDSHPPVLYGHLHMAKTGGTSLNGIMANKFDHVCGHKGYSYDAYNDNERYKAKAAVVMSGGKAYSRSRVNPNIMEQIGFENCDYVSHETDWTFWRDTFGKGKFHGLNMELHVPCRDRIEHLMSMCNYEEIRRKGDPFLKKHVRDSLPTNHKIDCDAKTDEELFDSVKKCFLYLDRYNHQLLEQFDVKCFDFRNQFTTYIDHMSTILSHRRFESTPYVKRETNHERNKEEECIWYNDEVRAKVDKFLLENIPYYQFCDRCMGSENEIATSGSNWKKVLASTSY